MQAAVPRDQGAMAAILGLDDAEIDAACREAAQGEVVEPVNFNAPGQVVVAGLKTAVERAIEAAKARGAKRAVLLPVSVPSHSSLMKGAAEELAARLAATPLRCPTSPPSTPSMRASMRARTGSVARSRSSSIVRCAGPTPSAP